jgi:hypothetical protein
MIKNIIIGCTIATVWFMAGRASNDPYSKIEDSITQEMKTHTTKYKDEFSFGYSIGLIKCSQIVHKVMRD